MTEPVYRPVPPSRIADALRNLSADEGNLIDQGNDNTIVGAVAAAPASGTIAVAITRVGAFFKLVFTLTAARVPVTDGGGSGSYGTLKLFDFVQSGISFLGCRQNYTAFAEGAALNGAAGDSVHVLGVGTVAAGTARDGTLTTTEQDIGTKTSQITNSAGTGAGTQTNGATVAGSDGTGTAITVNLNWSGTAATIDANSTIDVTGTIEIAGVLLGDD